MGDVAPVVGRGDIRAQSDFATASGSVSGSTPNFNQIRYLPQGEGRWLNQADEEQKRQVCVLGFQMMRTSVSRAAGHRQHDPAERSAL